MATWSSPRPNLLQNSCGQMFALDKGFCCTTRLPASLWMAMMERLPRGGSGRLCFLLQDKGGHSFIECGCQPSYQQPPPLMNGFVGPNKLLTATRLAIPLHNNLNLLKTKDLYLKLVSGPCSIGLCMFSKTKTKRGNQQSEKIRRAQFVLSKVRLEIAFWPD